MGLDMYLTAEKFFGGYSDEAGRDAVVDACGSSIPPMSKASASATVSFEVAYWRKANAIHGWFVQNVQDGEDRCERHHVTVDDIKGLVALCEGILAGGDPDALPPVEGFFFGPTDDASWYLDYLQLTVDQLKPLCAWFDAESGRRGEWSLFYQSSW